MVPNKKHSSFKEQKNTILYIRQSNRNIKNKQIIKYGQT